VGADLTATAAGNSPARQAQAHVLLEADASGKLQRFRGLAASSAFSTNVDFDKVVVYDKAGGVLDTRRYYAERHGGTAAGLSVFAREQGSWLARREAFEDLWERGRAFVYGAVNAGGMGVMGRFGTVCLVVHDPEGRRPQALAVFPGDSAARYTSTAGNLNSPLAHAEATAWTVRAELAVVHRRNDAATAAPSEWPRVLCRPGVYMEVVFAGPLPLAAVSEVRLLEELRKRLARLRARWLLGEPLTDVENNETSAYDLLQKWRREHGTAINGVAA
jgi:hypothetical protein